MGVGENIELVSEGAVKELGSVEESQRSCGNEPTAADARGVIPEKRSLKEAAGASPPCGSSHFPIPP
jgi:hypothetical protein